MSDAVRLVVNGAACALTVPRDAPLLNILRNDLGLNGPKYGCGLGECGACTVLVDGIEARSLDRIRFTPFAVICFHAAASEPFRSIARVASSIT